MNKFYIFAAVIITATTVFTGINYWMLRQSFMARVGMYVIILCCLVTVLANYLAYVSPFHLIWALPFGIGCVIYALFLIIKEVKKPFRDIKFHLRKVFAGDLNMEFSHQEIVRGDEVGKVFRLFDDYLTHMRAITQFAQEIGKGNLNYQFVPLGKGDHLGNGLIAMREQLRQAIDDAQQLVNIALKEGKLSASIDVGAKEGVWKEHAETLNLLFSSISTPLQELNLILQKLAEGDLSVAFEVAASGDIKQIEVSLNSALESLKALLTQIIHQADSIDETSRSMRLSGEEMNLNTSEIASAISEMSTGAARQLDKVGESSFLIDDILNISNGVSNQAELINVSAAQVAKESERGLNMVSKMVGEMKEVASISEVTDQAMQQLYTQTTEIFNFVRVIGEIASQTNMLALNAGIEAAQAGSAGRGFAVIAEEIRKLAENSKKSASEISLIIGKIAEDTQQAMEQVRIMRERILVSQKISNEAESTFKEIYSASSNNLHRADAILKEVQMQAQSVRNVSTLSESVVVIAEQTAAGTEEVASSATELSAGMQQFTNQVQELSLVADKLRAYTSQFRL